MTRASIIAALVRFARKIARWIFETLLRVGARGLAVYLRERVVVFKKRVLKARAVWRVRLLQERIAIHERVAKWLDKYAAKVSKKIVDEAEREFDRRVIA